MYDTYTLHSSVNNKVYHFGAGSIFYCYLSFNLRPIAHRKHYTEISVKREHIMGININ